MWRRWAGLAYKSTTGYPPFLMQNECDSSPVIFMKDHFMATGTMVKYHLFTFVYNECL